MADVHAWSSPVSLDAASTARLVRESLDHLGWTYETDAGERDFESTALVAALPKRTRTHRFRVEAPVDVTVECYDTQPVAGALVPYLEIRGFTDEERENVRALLSDVQRRTDRPLWKFTFGQRLARGLLAGEFRRARRAWRAFGLGP